MILEDFNALSDEQKTAYLSGIESDQKKIEDLTAERDSFKTENDSLRSQLEQNNKELTMARKINIGSKDDPETTLYNFMKGMK